MTYPLIDIGDIATFVNGFAFKPEDWGLDGLPIIRIQNLTDPSKPYNRTTRKVPSKYLVNRGDVLVSWSATIDVFEWAGDSALLNQHIFKVEFDQSKIDKGYFKIALKKTISDLSRFAHGSTMKHVVKKDFEGHQIPLPSIEEQIRIAHLLGKVEALITQRKQQLQQLDDLLKSVFLEMFGDPVRNEKGWDIQACEKVVLDISSGTSYGGEDRSFESSEELGVLKISAVTKGTFDPAEFKVVNKAQITKKLRFVKRGDFLFSRANTVELVAACCVVPEDHDRLFLPDKLWVLTLNADLFTPQFFNYLLKNHRYRDVVRNLASGGHDSMLNISMKKFMTLDVPCPPIELQNKFTYIVEKVEGLKGIYQKSLTDVEMLYGALSYQSFHGA